MEQSNGLHIFLVSLWCGVRAKKLRDSSGFGGYAGQFVGTQVLGFSAVLVPKNFKARSLVE